MSSCREIFFWLKRLIARKYFDFKGERISIQNRFRKLSTLSICIYYEMDRSFISLRFVSSFKAILKGKESIQNRFRKYRLRFYHEAIFPAQICFKRIHLEQIQTISTHSIHIYFLPRSVALVFQFQIMHPPIEAKLNPSLVHLIFHSTVLGQLSVGKYCALSTRKKVHPSLVPTTRCASPFARSLSSNVRVTVTARFLVYEQIAG